MSIKSTSFGLTTSCIQIHSLFLLWASFIGFLKVLPTIYIFLYNNSGSENSNAFEWYYIRSLVTISACVLVLGTISWNVCLVSLFLFPHSVSRFISTGYRIILKVWTFTCVVSGEGSNRRIVTAIDWNCIVHITGWSYLKFDLRVLSVFTFTAFIGI